MKAMVAFLLAACVAVPQPPAPRSVLGAHGPIAIIDTLFPDWDDSAAVEMTLGAWNATRREIALDRRLTWAMRPLVLGHERCHASIDDARVVLSPAVEEAVCDAIAAGVRP